MPLGSSVLHSVGLLWTTMGGVSFFSLHPAVVMSVTLFEGS